MSGFVWHWPQVVWAVVTGLYLLLETALDGTPRTGNHSLATVLLGTAISFALLYFGGFFAGATP